MIIYRHPTLRMPPWLERWAPVAPDAAVGLCRRETPEGLLIGVGDPLVFDAPADAAWAPIVDGWQATLVEPFEPRWLLRPQLWCEVADVPDLQGRGWAVPVVLKPDGSRAFRVAYGGVDFLPVLTQAQARALEIARAAREKLEEGDIDMSIGCRWMSKLLPITMCAPEEAFGALNLLDDRLTVLGLASATSLPLKRKE